MAATKWPVRPLEFWEPVKAAYFGGVTHVSIRTTFGLTKGEFDYHRRQAGWPMRNKAPVNRERLVGRLFHLINRQIARMEKSMDTNNSADVAMLNQLANTLGRLIRFEAGTTRIDRRARHTKDLVGIREKLVRRIEELKRADEEAGWVARLTDEQVVELYFKWERWAHQAQLPPPGDWVTWLLLGGRGAGKTRAGAEWVRGLVNQRIGPIALVGETIVEAIGVMIEGPSGIMEVTPPWERPRRSGSMLYWPNGVEALVLGASDPERFRGPQFAAAWCDETGKWPKAEAAWDMLQFGLRLGDDPRQLVTTTPRPTKLLKRLLADPLTIVTRMTTRDNKKHLAQSFLSAVVARYKGGVLGRQELEGELIEDLPGALWSRDMFRPDDGAARGRIVVAVDPPASSGMESDGCGIVVAGRTGAGAVVLADLTLQPAAPLDWANRAVNAFHDFGADCIVAEVNQGGEMVKAVIAQVDADVPVRAVHATRGKWVRAEPVAALYAQGRVLHAPGLTRLEDEMCGFGVDGRSDGHSPDRVDAAVWAVTELMLRDGPRVRGL